MTQRFVQPASEKKTWPSAFLALAQEQSPEYARNKKWKGTTTQMIREVDGLFYLQATINKHGRYEHCFAVSAASPDHHFGPFGCGGWFDHNFNIQDGLLQHLGITRREGSGVTNFQSSHNKRKGFEAIARGCMANAEAYLAPHYMSIIQVAAPVLLSVVEKLRSNNDALENEALRQTARDMHGLVSPSAIEVAAAAQAWPHDDVAQLAELIIAATGRAYLAPHLDMLDDIEQRLRRQLSP